ncbi:sigma factor-like helix-turn-helix DNA-binding protein [Streptomyces sp. NPDC048664]|uniref:sigma factor-like helix-turn-helix DNA-binding protein n=1 Tax=Streptomyces sp. NPDC048664 TaxID=3154505 RepID=UPI00342E1CAA
MLLRAQESIPDRASLAAVAEALAGLPPTYREAIVESYTAGRTTRQTAQALGLPHATVTSRIYHGLRHLRRALDERDRLNGPTRSTSRPAHGRRPPART